MRLSQGTVIPSTMEMMSRVAAALLAVITSAITILLSQHLSRFLHPLFGSIPSGLYRAHAEQAAFVFAFILLQAAMARSPAQNGRYSMGNPLMAFSSSLFAIPLIDRSLAVIGGDYLGPRWGALLPLLTLGTLLDVSGLWLTLACVTTAFGREDIQTELGKKPILASSALFAVVKVISSRNLYPCSLDVAFRFSQRAETIVCYVALCYTVLSSGSTAIAVYTRRRRPASSGRERTSTCTSILRVIQLTTTALAIQRACFAFPRVPYLAASNDLRVLNATDSVSGMVMVADNLKDGYRFLRCDHSLLGGRWLRRDEDSKVSDLGDTIFSTFVLQEACRLAASPDTLAGEDVSPRTLIIGLGAGIAADALIQHNHDVDVVEYDPAVFHAATRYLGLTPPRSVHLVDGAYFVADQATAMRAGDRLEERLYDFVVHDCFTGGSVPHDLFTLEFWEDLGTITAANAIIAVNFAGAIRSRATQAVLNTLVQSFSQCRAFTDKHGTADDSDGRDLSNIVIFCTNTQTSILTFRKPRQTDFLDSPLRRHILTDFLQYEIPIQNLMPAEPTQRHALLLKRGSASLDKDQVESALGTWTAMRKIMPAKVWRVY